MPAKKLQSLYFTSKVNHSEVSLRKKEETYGLQEDFLKTERKQEEVFEDKLVFVQGKLEPFARRDVSFV